MLHTLGAQERNVDTVETSFTSQLDFIVVWYSNHSAVWTGNQFHSQGNTVKVSHVRKYVGCLGTDF
jgi:hypothetical protein